MAKVGPVREGLSHPLGATWDGKDGVNFALFSAHATKVKLCRYDDKGKKEIARIDLPEFTDEIWHGYVPGVGPGSTGVFLPVGKIPPSVRVFHGPRRAA